MSKPVEHDPALAETTEKAVHSLFDVGRMWATHGLNVGRAALETSAATLRVTSSLLGTISDSLEPREHDAQAAPLAEEPEPAT